MGGQVHMPVFPVWPADSLISKLGFQLSDNVSGWSLGEEWLQGSWSKLPILSLSLAEGHCLYQSVIDKSKEDIQGCEHVLPMGSICHALLFDALDRLGNAKGNGY